MQATSKPKKAPRKLPPPGKREDFKTAQAKIIRQFDGAFRRLAR